MANKLTKEALDFINSDNELYKNVADALGIQSVSLPPYLRKNSRRLTEYHVLTIICKAMGKIPSEITEEVATKLTTQA